MKKGMTQLFTVMLSLFLILGLAAACSSKSKTINGNSSKADSKDSGNLSTSSSTRLDAPTGHITTTIEKTGGSTEKIKDTRPEKTSGTKEQKGTGTLHTTTPVKAAAEGKKTDLKGYTIKIAAWWNIDPKSPSNVYYEKAVTRENEVKKKYNIKLKYINVPGQGLKDKISSSVLAGDPVGDICRCRSGWVLPTLAGKGFIEPADKYFDISNPLWNPYITKQSMYKGRPMGVNNGPISSYACMLYNRSMMQKLGLADPQTLVASKKWTWSKFEEYVREIARDSNNDGKLDVYGTSNVSFQPAVASNGGRIVSDINGKDAFTLNRPEAVEALKWVQNINNMGVAGGTMADFANGNTGFFWWWNYDWGFKSSMKDKWGILPCPIGPQAKDYAAWWDEVHLMTIPANSKHPKEAAAIWTDLNKWYPGVNSREQMYQDILENQYLDQKDIKMAQYISTKFWLDKYFAYTELIDDMYPWPDNGSGIEAILQGKGTKSVDQWLAEKSGKYQSIIDQLWMTFKK